MDQGIIIEFELENPKLISINEQYMHPVRKAKSGRYYSYFAKSPYLVEVQEYYKEVLQNKIPDDKIKQLKSYVEASKSNGVSLTIEIGIPLRDIRENDVSNFIKAIEDCIVTRTKIDDNRDYEVISRKMRYESDDYHWMMKIKLSSYTLLDYCPLSTSDQMSIFDPLD